MTRIRYLDSQLELNTYLISDGPHPRRSLNRKDNTGMKVLSVRRLLLGSSWNAYHVIYMDDPRRGVGTSTVFSFDKYRATDLELERKCRRNSFINPRPVPDDVCLDLPYMRGPLARRRKLANAAGRFSGSTRACRYTYAPSTMSTSESQTHVQTLPQLYLSRVSIITVPRLHHCYLTSPYKMLQRFVSDPRLQSAQA